MWLFEIMNTIHERTLCYVLFATVWISAVVKAETFGVGSYLQINDRRFINVGPGDVATYEARPLTVDSLTITPGSPAPGAQFGQFVGYPGGTADNPGDGSGIAFATQTYIVDFNSPLAAFGVTFHHSPTDNAMDFPAILRVYDGAGGTGQLLGSMISSGWLGLSGGNTDFVGLWSDSLNIRSAVMVGTSEYKGFQVDAYGFSFSPVPEPSTLVILSLTVVGWQFWRNHRVGRQAASEKR